MKVRIGNVTGSIGARYNGYAGFASGDWFYLTYNINVNSSGTVTYDNALHRSSSFYFSQTEFRFAISNSNATVPVDRLLLNLSGLLPATDGGVALGSASYNYSALFANQINGRKISGAYYLGSPTSTSFTSGTWTKVGGTTTSVNLNGFTHSNNRITNNTGRTIIAKATVNATLQGITTTTDIFNIAISKNGSTSATDEFALSAQATRVTVSQFISVSTQVLISLSNGGYIEVYGRSVGATRTVEFSTLSVVIHEE